MKLMRISLTVLAFLLSTEIFSVEFNAQTVQGITPNGTIIFLLKDEKGSEIIPIPVRLHALTYPQRPDIQDRLLTSLRFKFNNEKTGLQNVSYKVVGNQDKFVIDENGVLLGTILQKSVKIMPSGNKAGITSDISADLLEDGICQYNGIYKDIDEKRHEAYLKCEASAKANNMGIWRKE